MGFWYKIRFPLMALGMISLLAGLWSGLLRLGWDVPVLRPFLPEGHGPLMAAGFLGVVIGLERAVAVGKNWSYAAPLFAGIGALALIFGPPNALGPALMTLGAAVLVVVNIVIIRAQNTMFTITMGLGSVALLIGDAMWLFGAPIFTMVMWWAGFLILTIAGERLELSRFLRPSKSAQTMFMIAAGVFIVGMALVSIVPEAGMKVTGAGMIAITAWLGVYDIARRTVKQTGLTRFVAVCLLSGYFWLGMAGLMALMPRAWEPGQFYDATLHSIFLGFVFSMIFGHAPIIFPAVLKVEVPYTPLFYIHLAILHVSLFMRIGADHAGSTDMQMWGGLLNEIALILFLANTIRAAVMGKLGRKA